MKTLYSKGVFALDSDTELSRKKQHFTPATQRFRLSATAVDPVLKRNFSSLISKEQLKNMLVNPEED